MGKDTKNMIEKASLYFCVKNSSPQALKLMGRQQLGNAYLTAR